MASLPKLAGPAEIGEIGEVPAHYRFKPHQKRVIFHAARLYGLGYSRLEVAKAVGRSYFLSKEITDLRKVRMMTKRLQKLERDQWFRDLVWDSAVVNLDMQGPQILRGVAAKAKRGRVDAAKLALGITGRYIDKANETPSAVTINLVGIPRPVQAVGSDGNEVLEAGEVIDED